MKFIKQSAALLILINTLLLFSCKKDTPAPGNGNIPQDTIPHDTIPEDTTVPLLTKVEYFTTLSVYTNTSLYTDSIYYNEKNQITQVVAQTGYVPITYSFSYNDDGSLASLRALGDMYTLRMTYNLAYKDNRITSIIVRDSSTGPEMNELKFSYNAQGKLLNFTSYFNDMGQTHTGYKIDYYRNEAGTVDSVNTTSMLGGTFVVQSTHPSAIESPVNKIWQHIDKAYLFMLSTRVRYLPFHPGGNNLYLHQFLNADDNFFNDGMFNSYSGTVGNKYEPYNTAFTLNADSTLKTYQYYQGPQGAAEEQINAKFSYIRK